MVPSLRGKSLRIISGNYPWIERERERGREREREGERGAQSKLWDLRVEKREGNPRELSVDYRLRIMSGNYCLRIMIGNYRLKIMT